ncbi:Probable prolyl 4-hydroxylase [Seminavis robusta]|uniref:Probable prolyl 4-hydroxylase n=1 Tax=Seminavis robusta TaxID=568900 RepID=A0A9N8DT68_9STRA|nr:Probable prolyl 4-hydroxylase [Seminavis robusta]|eukprot:Sro337_g120670.1 Probable prolyl 4-hydroxylase (264) ;mRNA; f:50482-51273
MEKLELLPGPIDGRGDATPTIAFVLRGFLSHEECQHYIRLAEARGLEPCEYDPKVRQTERLELQSESIGLLLWRRAREFLEDDIVLKKNAIPDDGGWREGIPRNTPEGTWIPTRVNQPIRICRYQPGGFFLPHHDGTCHHHPTDERSLQTIMVYLNDDFRGGPTQFYSSKQRHYCPGDPANRIHSFQPQTGDALIFFSAITHDGGAVTEGQKYILRSEIMYQRKQDDLISRAVEPDHDDTIALVPDVDGGFDYPSDDDEEEAE